MVTGEAAAAGSANSKGLSLGAVRRWFSSERGIVGGLVALALVQRTVLALIIPGFLGPDENGHFRYIRAIWTGNSEEVAGFQSWQPPTYGWLVSWGYGLTSGQPEQVQMVAVRLASIAIVLPEIVFAYLIARMLSPNDRFARLSTAAIVALLPGRLWIASVTNNDNLAALVSAALIYFLVSGLSRGFGRWNCLGLVVCVPLAVFSKLTAWPVAVMVVGIAALAALYRGWRYPLVRYSTIIAALFLSSLISLFALAVVAGIFDPAASVQSISNGQAATATPGGGAGRVVLLQFSRISPQALGRSWADLSNLPPLELDPFIFQFKSLWFPMWRDDYGPPEAPYIAALMVCGLAAIGLAGRPLLSNPRSVGGVRTRWRVACVLTMGAIALGDWAFTLFRHWVSVAGTGSFIPVRADSTALTARYLLPALIPLAYAVASGLSAYLHPRLRSVGFAALLAFLLSMDGVAYYLLISRLYWWPS